MDEIFNLRPHSSWDSARYLWSIEGYSIRDVFNRRPLEIRPEFVTKSERHFSFHFWKRYQSISFKPAGAIRTSHITVPKNECPDWILKLDTTPKPYIYWFQEFKEVLPFMATVYCIGLFGIIVFGLIGVLDSIYSILKANQQHLPLNCPYKCSAKVAQTNFTTLVMVASTLLFTVFPVVFYRIQRKKTKLQAILSSLRAECVIILFIGISMIPSLLRFPWQKYGVVMTKSWEIARAISH